jgi:hypothetical protein
MRLHYAAFLVASAVFGGCDPAQPDEPETTIYGFWENLDSNAEEYRSVSPTEVALYTLGSSDRPCFNESVSPVTSATDTRVEAVSPPHGGRLVLTLDSTDTDRMTSDSGVLFRYARAANPVRARREVKGSLCGG